MGRRKKEETVVETPVEMKEDAMNLPLDEVTVIDNPVAVPSSSVSSIPLTSDIVKLVETKEPVFKKIQCGASQVNVRQSPNGDVLFRINNLSKVIFDEEIEVDGVKWSKISGYVMSDLIHEL